MLRSASTSDRWLEFLTATELTTVDTALSGTARELIESLPPTDAATAVAEWVRAHVEYVPGSTEVRTSAQEAWSLRKGVCQDIAHLTLGMLRSVGIPTRYVSGYLYPKSDGAVGDTVAGQSHAWVEWWCGDWYGFDPTNGARGRTTPRDRGPRPGLRGRDPAQGRVPRRRVDRPGRHGRDHPAGVATGHFTVTGTFANSA